MAKQDRAVVVEGNTDVIALREAGFEPVVASMGTALTENQLRARARRPGGSRSNHPAAGSCGAGEVRVSHDHESAMRRAKLRVGRYMDSLPGH